MSNLRILKVEYRVPYPDDREYLTDRFKRLMADYFEAINITMERYGRLETPNGVIIWRVEDGKSRNDP
jgi:hypothetical protein